MKSVWPTFLVLLFAFWIGNGQTSFAATDLERILEAARAQADGQGTLKFTRITNGGRFTGCELQFSGATRDWRSKGGELVKFMGSISSFYDRGKNFAVFIKLRGEDFEFDSNGRLSAKPFVPQQLTLQAGKSNYGPGPGVQRLQCENGYPCWIFSPPGSQFALGYVESLMTDSLEFRIARTASSIDLVLNLAELKTKEENYPEYLRFAGCYEELVRHLSLQD